MTIDVTRQFMSGVPMIRNFKCKKTERLFNGVRVPAFSGFTRQAVKRLRILDASESISALKALPSNHLEALTGNRDGSFSIRVNMQWRVCFRWDEGAHEVEIIDYH